MVFHGCAPRLTNLCVLLRHLLIGCRYSSASTQERTKATGSNRTELFNIGKRAMATHLSQAQIKDFVRDHFEEFVNKRNAAVIRKNMTVDFFDHNGPGERPTGVDG